MNRILSKWWTKYYAFIMCTQLYILLCFGRTNIFSFVAELTMFAQTFQLTAIIIRTYTQKANVQWLNVLMKIIKNIYKHRDIVLIPGAGAESVQSHANPHLIGLLCERVRVCLCVPADIANGIWIYGINTNYTVHNWWGEDKQSTQQQRWAFFCVAQIDNLYTIPPQKSKWKRPNNKIYRVKTTRSKSN